ncbi:MAG: RNA 2',3'-cyclic phosphodiesterase [Candidatus Aenigmarchaeota archaeon]|nr:RNA 2',3'-cyclic phosphodiesterase [Candidatus Aenigmarchaeota archaeon]MDW8149069.1 RNA 2',3'-cyclic phosphodiesterase [Candidatus Aenigmarchaeota archaeon]
MRAFIGIFPPTEICDYVEHIKNKVEKLPIKAKFVEKNNLHISVTFLGEIRKEDYLNKIDKVVQSFKKFEVIINGIKLIPNESFIRVIVLSVVDKENNIIEIAKKIGGDYKEPHLTLARVKNIFDKASFFKGIKSIKVEERKFLIEKISFVESVLTREGPIYRVIKDFFLL